MTPDRKNAPCSVHPGPTLARAGRHRGLLDQSSRLLIDYEQGLEYWMFQVRYIEVERVRRQYPESCE